MSTLAFEYDAFRDILTVEGVAYSGSLFRQFALLEADPHRLMKVTRNNTLVTVKVVNDPGLARLFDLSAK